MSPADSVGGVMYVDVIVLPVGMPARRDWSMWQIAWPEISFAAVFVPVNLLTSHG